MHNREHIKMDKDCQQQMAGSGGSTSKKRLFEHFQA